MKTLTPQRPAFLTIYISTLVFLWVAATIANISTIFGLSVNPLGLVGISVFVGVMLVRSYTGRAH